MLNPPGPNRSYNTNSIKDPCYSCYKPVYIYNSNRKGSGSGQGGRMVWFALECIGVCERLFITSAFSLVSWRLWQASLAWLRKVSVMRERCLCCHFGEITIQEELYLTILQRTMLRPGFKDFGIQISSYAANHATVFMVRRLHSQLSNIYLKHLQLPGFSTLRVNFACQVIVLLQLPAGISRMLPFLFYEKIRPLRPLS